MHELALLVKSYAADFIYAQRLIDSINSHNVDSLPVYIVVPDSDAPLFQSLIRENIFLHFESEFESHLVDEETAGFRPGYINQEIIKLAFWELDLAENYLCVDSDAVFVRDFTRADFMARPDVPFTFLTEDRELQVEPNYYHSTWVNRITSLEKIKEAIGYEGRWLLTVHGHAVFSSKVLESFKRDFLEPRGWDYRDALTVSPYEPTWYNTWLLHTSVIEIIPREPIVKTFHNATQHLDYVLRGVSEEDLARGYIAVVVNSNYSRGDGVLSLSSSPTKLIASYVSFSNLFAVLGKKIRVSAFRRS